MNANLTSMPDTLNLKDRVYTNLYLHFRPKQVKVNPSERNTTNLGYLFLPGKVPSTSSGTGHRRLSLPKPD